MRAALVVAAALLLLPTVQAQGAFPGHVLMCTKECRPSDVNDDDLENAPVNVILYAHITDVLQRAPLNAMPPDPGRERDLNRGMVAPTVKIREDLVNFENNWFFLYHLPRFVEYEGATPNQDGPLSYPLELVGPRAKLYWYLSPHVVPNQNSTDSPVAGVGAMPSLTVSARIDTGRHPLHGTLIAQGQTSSAAVVNLPGGDYAYEFEVPLDIKTPVVEPEGGFVVSVNWFQVEDGDKQFSQGDWRIRSGIRFAPRLILPVQNPMQLTDTSSVYRAGTHYIVTDLSPVFGAYDINPYSLNMTFQKGPQAVPNPAPLFYFYNPIKPQTVKIAWAVPQDGGGGLEAGTYRFDVSATNLQSTYRFSSEVFLEILEFRTSAKAPDIGPMFFLGVLALALFARRRA